jgi:hypothetical protein
MAMRKLFTTADYTLSTLPGKLSNVFEPYGKLVHKGKLVGLRFTQEVHADPTSEVVGYICIDIPLETVLSVGILGVPSKTLFGFDTIKEIQVVLRNGLLVSKDEVQGNMLVREALNTTEAVEIFTDYICGCDGFKAYMENFTYPQDGKFFALLGVTQNMGASTLNKAYEVTLVAKIEGNEGDALSVKVADFSPNNIDLSNGKFVVKLPLNRLRSFITELGCGIYGVAPTLRVPLTVSNEKGTFKGESDISVLDWAITNNSVHDYKTAVKDLAGMVRDQLQGLAYTTH